MANEHTTLMSLFSDIASAIRRKTGDSAPIVADDFPAEIDSIVTDETEAYTGTYTVTPSFATQILSTDDMKMTDDVTVEAISVAHGANHTVYIGGVAADGTAENNGKVVLGDGTVLVDLTEDTVSADKVLSGYTAHDNSGAQITGECTFDSDTSGDTAVSADVLAGKTAHAGGSAITGSMTNNGAVAGVISSKSGTYTVPQGYHNGSGTVQIDAGEQAKIISDNIKSGVEILGVSGSTTIVDTSSATASADDINYGKTAYVNGVLLQGTNDFIKPTKGVIFGEWDEDGYPHTVEIVGIDYVPDIFLMSGVQSNRQYPTFFSRITQAIVHGSLIGERLFERFRSLTDVIFVDNTRTYSYIIRYCDNMKNVTYLGDADIRYTFMGETSIESVVIKGQVTRWENPFYTNANSTGYSVMLYDFSGCESVFSLPAVFQLPHANGCVIKVKKSLLASWKIATNWCDLPTDPNVSGYVVWEGV